MGFAPLIALILKTIRAIGEARLAPIRVILSIKGEICSKNKLRSTAEFLKSPGR